MRAQGLPLAPCTIAAGMAFKLLELAVASGMSPDAVRAIPLPPRTVNGLETRIPFETQLALWETAMRALRDPGFPISVASRIRPSDYSVIGFACMTSASLGEALRLAVRYRRILSDATSWEVREDGDTAILAHHGNGPLRLGMRVNAECAIAEMVNAARALVGRPIVAAEIRFHHDKPTDTRAHESFFRSPIRWGAEITGVVFDRALLAAPLVKTDPALAAFFRRHTDALLQRIAGDESVASRLEAVLVEQTPHGQPTLEASAKRLGMSSRTMRRRLREEGTRYQEVLDRARCDLAKRYLEDPKLAVGEVAFLLGFSEVSAFHRAFKRWTGETPVTFRDAAPSGARQ
jgi:AraC-like DNA-binding protein